jgi:2-amino-4-hydroxy-6-hydroxymethyldihydropteridine diphosphokinase
MSRALIALGGNLDRPSVRLLKVMAELDDLPHSQMLRVSSLYRTAPVGYAEQPDFINAAALIETTLPPQALMAELLAIETRHGRLRTRHNGPRTLDLDLLMYDNQVLDDSFVTLPHPRMHQRAFVLTPLLEIAPDCDIPRHGLASKLLAACADRNQVVRLEHVYFDWGMLTLRKLGKGMIATAQPPSGPLH